jgi:hypothetical protein
VFVGGGSTCTGGGTFSNEWCGVTRESAIKNGTEGVESIFSGEEPGTECFGFGSAKMHTKGTLTFRKVSGGGVLQAN